MARVDARPADEGLSGPRKKLGRRVPERVSPPRQAPSDPPLAEEIEAVARIGSYALDIPAGRWVSSKGLDAIFGIDAGFERSVESWGSLVHPDDRDAMLSYFAHEVIGEGRPFDRQYRIVRADTGAELWVHGRGRLELDASGRVRRMLGTIADITDHRNALDELTRARLRFEAVFEGSADAILVTEQATNRLLWANRAACTLLGYTRNELLELTVRDIESAPELPLVLQQIQELVDGQLAIARAMPCRRKDGTTVLVDARASTSLIDGELSTILSFSDVTELRRLEAHDRQLALAVEQTSEAVLITSLAGTVIHANPAFKRLVGIEGDEPITGTATVFGALQSPAATEEMWAAVSAGGSWSGSGVMHRHDGAERLVEASISPVRDDRGATTGLISIGRDVTEERVFAAERDRLAAAVAATSDSVIIADLDGTIQYVNAAFERASGYRRDEAIGQNPRILKSGRHSSATYRAMWRRILRGDTWNGTLVNRRKDGSLYEEEVTISPMRGPSGQISGYVGVKRDVTALRAAESGLARQFRERSEVTAALARLQLRENIEETGTEICDQLASLAGIDLAAIFIFIDDQHAVTLAVVGPEGLPVVPGRALPIARATYLHQRASQGPWAEEWRPRPEDGRYGAVIAELGIRAVAYAPIRSGGTLLGVVACGTRDEAYVRHMIDHLPAVGEFASTASVLLGDQLRRGHLDDAARERVRRALEQGGLRPVFQPIVLLASGEHVGYEALTRFTDGTSPDRMFADARAVGLDRELEVTCIAAAIDASLTLGPDSWLSLNVSPHVLVRASELRDHLRARSRIVIEITEHAEIDDYDGVRSAVAAIGPAVQLAVDDAGAGFASLQHVVELKPRFLKLDLSLVRDVDRDATRQAMIAGLVHFAARAGCEVIAEGIERPAELAMLRELGVTFGQGYLLGRPGPLPIDAGKVDGTSASWSRAPAGYGARSSSPSTAVWIRSTHRAYCSPLGWRPSIAMSARSAAARSDRSWTSTTTTPRDAEIVVRAALKSRMRAACWAGSPNSRPAGVTV